MFILNISDFAKSGLCKYLSKLLANAVHSYNYAHTKMQGEHNYVYNKMK